MATWIKRQLVMNTLNLLTPQEVEAVTYDSFNKMDLNAMIETSKGGECNCSLQFNMLNLLWEQTLFHFASKLSQKYTGGNWTTENGFYVLNGYESEIFKVADCWGSEYEMNSLEFSITVNLFALSNISISTFGTKPAINRRAVFFSDYIKEIMNKNANVLNLSPIYRVID